MITLKDNIGMLAEAVLKEGAPEGLESLKGEYPGSRIYKATGDGSNVKGQITKKMWDDGAPMTVKFGPNKSFNTPKGEFWILETDKFWYYRIKDVWYAIKGGSNSEPFGFEY